MEKILTILARNPAHGDDLKSASGDPPAAYDPYAREGDTAIADVVSRLWRRQNGASHTFMRADSVEMIVDVLDAYASGCRLIQIIGHASVAELWLGAMWSPENKKVNYVLDSSPSSYGLMPALDATTTVWLLGCTLGATAKGCNANIVDGATLVFDIARVLKCNVGASVDLVSASDFDESTGVFRHETRLTTSGGVSVFEPREQLATLSLEGEPLRMAFSDCSSVSLGDALSNVEWKTAGVPSLLAAPEAVCMVKTERGHWRGEILAKGQLLRLVAVGPDGARTDLRYLAPVRAPG